MSFQTTSYVIKRKFGNQTRKLIMLCIADYTGDDTGTAWAYIDTLADRAECSRRSVQEHLDRLEEAGEIEIYRNAGPKGSHRYRIIFRKSGEEIQPAARGAEFAPRTNEQVQTTAKGCKPAPLKQHERGANQRRSVAPKTILKGIRKEERENAPARTDQFSETFRVTLDHIATLRPEWAAAPGYSKRERLAFMDNVEALEAVAPEHWETVRRYLAARLPEGSAGFQPVSREQFLTGSNDVLARALQWERKQAKPSPPKPKHRAAENDEPPMTAEEIAEFCRTSPFATT